MAFDTDVIDDSVESTPDVETPEAEPEEAKAEPETEQVQDEAENDGDEQSESETPDDESKPDKKPSRASERIQQLVDERNAAKAELEQLRQQSQQPQQREQSTDGAPVKPNVDDYDLDSQDGLDDYFAAQAEYDNQLDDWDSIKRNLISAHCVSLLMHKRGYLIDCHTRAIVCLALCSCCCIPLRFGHDTKFNIFCCLIVNL